MMGNIDNLIPLVFRETCEWQFADWSFLNVVDKYVYTRDQQPASVETKYEGQVSALNFKGVVMAQNFYTITLGGSGCFGCW